MQRFAVFASLTALGLVFVQAGGCAAGTQPFGPVGDAGVTDTRETRDSETKFDFGGGTPDTNEPPADTMVVEEEDTSLPTTPPTPSTAPTYDPGPKTKPAGAGTSYDDTVGKPCSSDVTCDVTGFGETLCAKGAFGGDSLFSTPVCVGAVCNPGDGTSVMSCDGVNGVCLATSSGGVCLPLCDFDATSGYKPSGCKGKDVCNAYGWGPDSTGKVTGVGFCLGGCFSDADCPSGEQCQREVGSCKAMLDTYTKPIGAACAKGDTDCNCLYFGTSPNGYCSAFCKMGESGWCPGGYTCDAFLPKTDSTGATLFTKAPATMSGYCTKNCATNADCTNGYCAENAGTGRKTCQPGTP